MYENKTIEDVIENNDNVENKEIVEETGINDDSLEDEKTTDTVENNEAVEVEKTAEETEGNEAVEDGGIDEETESNEVVDDDKSTEKEGKNKAAEDAEIHEDEDFLYQLPPFPIEIFDPNIQNILETVARGKCVPLEMVGCAFLALGSCCIGRSRGIAYNDDWREYANLYLLLAAETGTGKSHVFNYFFDEVRLADEVLTKKFNEEWEKYQEDMAYWKKSKKGELDRPKPPKKMANLINDATIEAVLERLEHNPRGLFWEVDEFAGFFGRLDRYNKSGTGDGKSKLLTMWDSGKIAVSRKNNEGIVNELYIPHATVGMYGAIQPDLISSTFTKNDVNQGVPQRFVFVRAKQVGIAKLPYPKINSQIKEDIKKIVNSLLSLEMNKNDIGSPEAKFLTLTSEASAIFDGFANIMKESAAHSELAGYAAKMVSITLRLALILHFLEWATSTNSGDEKNVINEATMNRATLLASYLFEHTRKVHELFIVKPKDSDNKDMTAKIIKHYADEKIIKHEKDGNYLVPASEIIDIVADVNMKHCGLNLNLKDFRDELKKLGVVRKRYNHGRFYIFTPAIIENCERTSFKE